MKYEDDIQTIYVASYGTNQPQLKKCMSVCVCNRVESGLGHLGHPGHILSGSSGPDPLYKISGSDLDSTLYHVC